MTPDSAEEHHQCGHETTAVEAASLVAMTDAEPNFPYSTGGLDGESEGKSGKVVNPKIAIDNNLQLLDNSVRKTELTHASSNKELQKNMNDSNPQSCENTSEKYQHINKYIATGNITEYCIKSARRLSKVIIWIKEKGDSKMLLREFAHSGSCKNRNCRPFCNLFQRLRKHVMSARHKCTLLRLYSLILRLHVNACTDNNCGLEACPILRSKKEFKHNGRDNTGSFTKKPYSDYVPKRKRPFLISRIVASDTGNKLVIFFAKPIRILNIPLPNPPNSKLIE